MVGPGTLKRYNFKSTARSLLCFKKKKRNIADPNNIIDTKLTFTVLVFIIKKYIAFKVVIVSVAVVQRLSIGALLTPYDFTPIFITRFYLVT
jgi:hypothetical protein